jgi:hypothetical protein
MPNNNKEVFFLTTSIAFFSPRQTGFDSRLGNVEFMVQKLALKQVYSEYFGSPHQLLRLQ